MRLTLIHCQFLTTTTPRLVRYSERWHKRLHIGPSLVSHPRLQRIMSLWNKRNLGNSIFPNTYRKFQQCLLKNGWELMIKMSILREFISQLEKFIQSFSIKRLQTKLTVTSLREEELIKYPDSIKWFLQLKTMDLRHDPLVQKI